MTNLMLAAQVTTQHVPSSYSRPCTDISTIPVVDFTDKSCNQRGEIYSCNKSFDLDRATSSCSGEHNRIRSHSAPLAATNQSARMHLSPTSVSSSVSTFIYPPLTGHCHLVSEVIIDVETSVLAYSQVATVNHRHIHYFRLNLDKCLSLDRNGEFLYHTLLYYTLHYSTLHYTTLLYSTLLYLLFLRALMTNFLSASRMAPLL